ncbi:zinc-alpha-2-glycoprotein-like [Erythrolamprus reginae]|uniref:zinc-alpha-2-glycoprotein-like n=1 Tax=Erythrolamprus reginae TaxID=121349 RepID=UPI00396CC1CB
MVLQLPPLLLLWAVLGSLVLGGQCGSSRHSLCYSYLKVSESSQGLPRFLSVVHLDNQPIARYDILNGKTVPLVPWMEAEEMKAPERMFRADLEQLSELNHQTGGLHTWQVDLGCELREDGSKRGFLHYGYDGMDFISFEKETLRWVPAQPQARMVKEKREDDPSQSQRNKFFLEETCIEWLQRYLSYQKVALEKTEPPVGKVTGKVVNDRLEVLICQAFGFYPKEIQATWTRDGEVCKYETLPRNVAPNSDGTYYIWLSIEIDPKERDHFRCHIEHEGLQEPLILAFKEDPARTWWIPVGIVAAIILGAFFFKTSVEVMCRCLEAVDVWMRVNRLKLNPGKKGVLLDLQLTLEKHLSAMHPADIRSTFRHLATGLQQAEFVENVKGQSCESLNAITTCRNQISREKSPSSPIDGIEDETQSLLMLQTKSSSKHNTTFGRQSPKDTVLTLVNGEQKRFILAAAAAAAADATAAIAINYDDSGYYDYDCYYDDYYHDYYDYFTNCSDDTEFKSKTE